MPTFTRGDTSIYYERHGSGFPVLLLAPGGMRSSIAYWDRAPFHPVRELSSQWSVIAMDQRNAGQSRGPISSSDDWRTYTADQLALLDHLGVHRCHLLGGCIGGAFAFSLLKAAPERVAAAVLQQPIGFADNRDAFSQIFDSWADELLPGRPDIDPAVLPRFKENLYGGEFVFSVSRDEVGRCPAPLLILRGNDVYHPSAISEEIVRLAPRAELVPSWKEGDDVPRAVARIKAFLATHTPAPTSP